MCDPRRCSKCGEWMNIIVEYNYSEPHTYWQCPNGCIQDTVEISYSNTRTQKPTSLRYCANKYCMCNNANDRGYCEFTACIYEDALNRGKNEKQIISIPKITIS